MKKYSIILIFLLSFNISCDCDAPRYQIVEKNFEKNSVDNVKCNYKANALTSCAAWQTRKYYFLTDSCSLFQMSQVVDLKDLNKYK